MSDLSILGKTRTRRQMDIEEAIDKFSPDYLESSEIIAAVVGQLRHRYDGNLSANLEQCFADLFDQLDAEQEVEPGIDEMTASKWEDMKQAEEEELLLNGHRTNDANE